jgi:hypothetical protein
LLYLQRDAFGSELSKSIKRIPVKVGRGMGGGLYCRVSSGITDTAIPAWS